MNELSAKSQQKHLKQCIEFILEECRMVLPGIQALFGFQMIAVFNQRFAEIAMSDKLVHLAAIMFTVVSIGFLMGPAAYHRQSSPFGMPPELCQVGTVLVRLGMLTLMVAITLEIYLVTKVIMNSTTCSIATGAITFCVLATLWYLYPGSKRAHDDGNLQEGLSLSTSLTATSSLSDRALSRKSKV